MKIDLLLPHGFQKIGWTILIPTLLLGVVCMLNNWTYPGNPGDHIVTILNNIVLIGIAVGGVMVCCSREKVEDELIGRLRLNALLTAFYVNYALFVIACLAVYDTDFLNVMLCNLFTMMFIFLGVFRYKLWRLRKEAHDEE